MEKFIKKYKEAFIYYIPFFVLFFIEIIIHSSIVIHVGDDLVFKSMSNQDGFVLSAWLKERYLTWSSRTFIEAALVLMVNLPVWVWRICDSALIAVSALFMTKIMEQKNNKSHKCYVGIIISMLILTMPYIEMCSAGWISTTLNYMWPVAFGIIAVYPVRKYLEGQKVNGFASVFYTCCLLFSASSEQMCFVLMTVYAGYILYIRTVTKNRIFVKGNGFIVRHFFLSLLMFIIALAAPGNRQRSLIETKTWLPDFAHFSILKKIELGISSTLKSIFLDENIIFLLLLFLIAVLIWQNHRSWLYRTIGAIPALVGAYFYVLRRTYDEDDAFLNIVEEKGGFSGERLGSYQYFLLFFLLIFVCCLILLSFYILFEDKVQFVIISGIFIVGLATKAVMGFSPTIWESGGRTGWVMGFAFLACFGYLLKKLEFKNNLTTYFILGLVTWKTISGFIMNVRFF